MLDFILEKCHITILLFHKFIMISCIDFSVCLTGDYQKYTKETNFILQVADTILKLMSKTIN